MPIDYTLHRRLRKPTSTTPGRTAIFNENADLLDLADEVKATAGEVLGAFVPVAAFPDGRMYASSAGTVTVGCTTVAASGAGADVYVAVGGVVVNPAWAWSPGFVYVGTTPGTLTQSPTGDPFGLVLNATTLLVFYQGHAQHGEIWCGVVEAQTPAASGAAKVEVDGTNAAWAELRFGATVNDRADWVLGWPAIPPGAQVVVVVWWKAAETSGSVKWAADVLSRADDTLWDTALVNRATVLDTANAVAERINRAVMVFSMTGVVASWAPTFLRIRRQIDAEDTMSGLAKVLGVHVLW